MKPTTRGKTETAARVAPSASGTGDALIDRVTRSSAVAAIAGLLGEPAARAGANALSVSGIVGSSTVFLAGALARRVGATVLLVVAHLDEADEAEDELEAWGVDVLKFVALEVIPGETSVNLELLAERLGAVRRLAEGAAPAVIVAPIHALMQTVPERTRLDKLHRVVRPGDTFDLNAFATWLVESGYRRVEMIESPGEFAIRGGIADIFAPGGEPTRLDTFGDEIERIFAIDLDSMGSDRRLDRLEIVGATAEDLASDEGTVSLLDYLEREKTIAMLAEVLELTEQGRSYYERVSDARGIAGPPAVFAALARSCRALIDVNQFSAGAVPDRVVTLPLERLPTFAESIGEAVGELAQLAEQCEVLICCQNDGEAQRMHELVAEFAPAARIAIATRYLHRGLIWGDEESAIALVPYHELLHRYQTRRRVRRLAGGRAIDAFIDLAAGDYVVHRDHGIARFLGLRTLESASGASEEFLTLEFARGARLNVPAAKIALVQKYVGAFTGQPELSTHGGRRWKAQKEKVTEAVRDLAAEMLRLQAMRASMPGIRFPPDTAWQREFEAEFPYEETEDQLSAIGAVKRDMASEQPMDRLVCGDVGFGKTEVAIRAAFKAAEYGKQVAVLVPTTVLADQHERTFRERFADYPFRIEALSRFRTKAEQKAILDDVRRGRVDIVIGTHRLLSKDVHFADLGLVVIDEEQRFGVEHKQRLLAFRSTSDVLTLSATPIPRTLHMAMLGLRDISSLSTPPLDRRAIVTEVIPHNQRRLAQVLARELAREGQIFWVHNRVHDILSVADDVQRLAPEARILVGHGQMPSRELERVMLKFVRGQADILVCTTIIESGIDIPTANTMVIDDANIFGLSELHQLRGRVGRYKHRAYCYLILPKDKTVSEQAMKRLRALESFSMLGAGFKIALRDLELRGAGNLLGAEQSGHIAAVGYEMYCQLLERSVKELKHEPADTVLDTTIDLGIAGAIPRGWIPSDARRMDAYRRISTATDASALDAVRHDLESAYGEPPKRAKALVDLAEIRIAASRLGIVSIARHEGDLIFRTARPRDLGERMQGVAGSVRLVGDVDEAGLTTVYYRPPPAYFEGETILAVLRKRLCGEAAASGAASTAEELDPPPASTQRVRRRP